jgi:hypothetical protein
MIVQNALNENQEIDNMNIAFCNFYEELNVNNFMFENNNAPIGDDLLKPFVELRNKAKSRNVNIATVDVLDPELVDAFVFVDMPERKNKYFNFALKHNKLMYLIVLESRLTRKENYVGDNHKFFKKIFTYNDDYIDNIKYFKLNYTFSFPSKLSVDCRKKEKLCVMIAGNKKSNDPCELYSKREEIIRWFEKNHPEDFDLYGTDWDKYTFPPNKLIRHLNRSKFLRNLFHQPFSSYRGKVDRKIPVLKKYKFSVVCENICDVPGYITEKIFDSLISGCIPIYRGAQNIQKHVPSNCFIDMRVYNTYAELYNYIVKMSINEYESYLENIEKYFNSEGLYNFSTDCFSDTLLREIVSE